VGAADLQGLLGNSEVGAWLRSYPTPLGHVPDDGDLLGHTSLALGEVPGGLGEVFLILLHGKAPIMRLIAGAGHESR